MLKHTNTQTHTHLFIHGDTTTGIEATQCSLVEGATSGSGLLEAQLRDVSRIQPETCDELVLMIRDKVFPSSLWVEWKQGEK